MAHDVLLIEDSPTQAAQIKATLESVGLQVRVAYDGPDGLRMVLEQKPALIVLDVKLPTMDGFQVCRRLKRAPETASIPVIMLTEKDGAQATMSGLQAGADDYIPKDIFATEHLMNTLQELGLMS
ncbi:MAG TPA: response regulator [Aggregatilineales bacterium]|jgi:DNA-binding response OmpR family regulator|nr:response regulator [Anaerolineae bacterium]HUN08787.1 response regulator [Aggregatilineales bacterium]